MKTVYKYNEITGEYLGDIQASKDPRSSDVQGKDVYFTIPNTTNKKPKSTEENEVNVFEDDKWVVKDDFRGTDYWEQNGTKVTIEDIDVTVPDGCLTTPPPNDCLTNDGSEWILDCSCCKNDKKKEVNTSYDNKINEGYTYGENIFDCDDATLSIIGARLSLANSSTTLEADNRSFYDTSRTKVEFADRESFILFCQSMIDYRNKKDQKRVSLKANIDSCETVKELEDIDLTIDVR